MVMKMKNKKITENIVHGIFLVLGLITVACVALISIYLIISGIPAIREIGLVDFLFGTTWEPTSSTPRYGILPFILTSISGDSDTVCLMIISAESLSRTD